MNKSNKTSTFLILKQYYTKISFNFIIYSNEKSLSVKIKKLIKFSRMNVINFNWQLYIFLVILLQWNYQWENVLHIFSADYFKFVHKINFFLDAKNE